MIIDDYHVPEKLNDDFSRPALVRSRGLAWIPSQEQGVFRRFLDRRGKEIARATSIVRYVAGSRFPTHTHGLGEEYLVLEGTFCDQHGEYPVGAYVRNPPGSHHAPFTKEGCIIFVKLRQMQPEGEPAVVVHHYVCADTAENGIREARLFDSPVTPERVSIKELAAGVGGRFPDSGGLELLMLEGELKIEQWKLEAGDWLRLPPGSDRKFDSGSGCRFWIKRGHLKDLGVNG